MVNTKMKHFIQVPTDTKLLNMLELYLQEITSVDPNMDANRLGNQFATYLWEYSTGDVRKDILNMIEGKDYTKCNTPSTNTN